MSDEKQSGFKNSVRSHPHEDNEFNRAANDPTIGIGLKLLRFDHGQSSILTQEPSTIHAVADSGDEVGSFEQVENQAVDIAGRAEPSERGQGEDGLLVVLAETGGRVDHGGLDHRDGNMRSQLPGQSQGQVVRPPLATR